MTARSDAEQPSEQPSVFDQATSERERITTEVARRFACYGEGTQVTSHNAIALTLAEQPAQFGFGVPVRAVVDAVCDMAGVLPITTVGGT